MMKCDFFTSVCINFFTMFNSFFSFNRERLCLYSRVLQIIKMSPKIGLEKLLKKELFVYSIYKYL